MPLEKKNDKIYKCEICDKEFKNNRGEIYNHGNKSTFKSSLISGIYENVSILFCVVLVNQGTSEYAFIYMIVNLHLQL